MSRFKNYAGLFANQGNFDIPANATIGIAVKATPAVTLAADYQRIDYSKVVSIGNSATTGPLGGTPGGGFGWRNIDVFKLGAQWQMNPTVMLRAGYAHGDNPVTGANITPNILAPGVVTSHYTLGGTYALSPASEVTWAFMYAPRVKVTGPSLLAGTESVSMKQTSIGLQWGMKF
jgi:long-chain fatty acid transport protein